MLKTKQCIECGQTHNNVSLVCPDCVLIRHKKKQRSYWFTPTSVWFFGQSSSKIPWQQNIMGDYEMPKATLSYEALQLDESTGDVVEGAYKLKLEGNFNTHIEPIVKFIKATVPTSERTYEPTTREWFYHEKYHPTIMQMLQGIRFVVEYVVRKEDFVELKRKQAEWARQAGQQFKQTTHNTDEDITKFGGFLIQANLYGESNFEKLKAWTRQEAEKFWKRALLFYHPDFHPERATQASQLNEVWARLKEGYYIK